MTSLLQSRSRILRNDLPFNRRFDNRVIVDKSHPYLQDCAALYLLDGTYQALLKDYMGGEPATVENPQIAWDSNREIYTNGSSTRVIIPTNALPTAYPFAFRFVARYTSGTNSYLSIGNTGNNVDYTRLTFVSSGAANILHQVGSGNSNSATTPTLVLTAEHYHDVLGVVKANGAVDIYIDGVFQATDSTKTIAIPAYNTFNFGALGRVSTAYIGGEGLQFLQVFHSDPSSRYFEMYQDRYAFVKKPLEKRFFFDTPVVPVVPSSARVRNRPRIQAARDISPIHVNNTPFTVDKKHPFLRDCVGLFLMDEYQSGTVKNYMGGSPATLINGNPWDSERGISLDNASSQHLPMPAELIPDSFPFAFRLIAKHISSTYNSYWSLGMTSTNDTYSRIALESGNGPGLIYQEDTPSSKKNYVTTSSLLTGGVEYDVVGVVDSSGGVHLYLNGRNIGSVTVYSLVMSTFNTFHYGRLQRTTSNYYPTNGTVFLQVFHGDPRPYIREMYEDRYAFIKRPLYNRLMGGIIASTGYPKSIFSGPLAHPFRGPIS